MSFARLARLLALVLVSALSSAAWAGPDGFEVSKLELRYASGLGSDLPALRDLLYDEVELVEVEGVLEAPAMGSVVRRYKLFELASGGVEMTSSALDAVLSSIDQSLDDRWGLGFASRPASGQFARVGDAWVDRRLFGSRLTIEVYELPEPLGLSRPTVPLGSNVVPAASAAPVGPPTPRLEPFETDGPGFEVEGVELSYVREHPKHPAIEELLATPIALTPTPDGWVAPRGYGPVVVQPIGAIGRESPAVLHASALATITRSLVERLRDLGLVGMFVEPSPDAIEQTRTGLVDRRPGQTGAFPIDIYTAIVTRIGSSATGDRIALEERIDHPYHRRIRERSPVRPFTLGSRPSPLTDPLQRAIDAAAEEGEGPEAEAAADREIELARWDEANAGRLDLLREDSLNAYAQRLNRHPGRRVDIAIAPGEEPFEAELQYVVQEDKPWTLFTQLSNTGTESTSEFRQRIGFIHTQLTNADDILSLDFTTSEFSDTNAFVAAYDRPLLGSEKVRWVVSGGWNEYNASDVGSAGESFEGESWFWSFEVVGNIFQHEELFVDAYAGVRYQDITVTDLSPTSPGPAQEAIFLPRVGLRMNRLGAWSSISAFTQFEWTWNDVSAADSDGLEELGRIDPVDEWVVFSGGFSGSVFLEPLLNNRAWNDPSTPESSTLAHELAIRFAGQYGFNQRLIPNAEGVIGGLYTVRGYPESVAAGDSVYTGSIEYRFHVPRAFAIEPQPRTVFGRPFRAAPQQVYGSPDWNLMLKGFFDFGQSFISQPLGFEQEETLASVGVGLELQLYRNLSFRTDWGFVLSEVGDETSGVTERGDERVHLLFTLAF
ncbi:MAG: hypothetical protein AAGI53_11950 [Planctomycetota bacterium]